MTEPALQLSLEPNTKKFLHIEEEIRGTHTEEIIIGLCGPIGTDIHFVANTIKDFIEERYQYKVIKITLSDLIRKHSTLYSEKITDSRYDIYSNLINAGNDLRSKFGNSILAELAINEIAVKREENKKSEDDDFNSMRYCYIIDSIKNIEELNLLRLVYRDIFYFFGVFSNLTRRTKYLLDKGVKDEDINRLINRDSGEEEKFGQKVTNTFVEADFFLRVEESSMGLLEPKILRYLGLIFASDVITPTINETAMYLASAAAGNSACLSRQVGASITDINGEILAVGWNDVPKAGGSVYQTGVDIATSGDRRCYNKDGGMCFNDNEKSIISNLLVNDLISNNIIVESDAKKTLDVIMKSRIKELIEFSRAVHAEMLAIILASQKAGSKMIDGKLYCTTYPCHNCARHIIAAGIKEVYFIEPYRKSLATKLHDDSITEDENKEGFVKILMYDGVAPNRYLEFFKMAPNSRKSNGKKINPKKKDITPKNTLSLTAIPILEKKITEDLKNKNLINA